MYKRLTNSIFFKVLFVIIAGIFSFDIFFSLITGSYEAGVNTANLHGHGNNSTFATNDIMVNSSNPYNLYNSINNIENFLILTAVAAGIITIIGFVIFAYYSNQYKNKS